MPTDTIKPGFPRWLAASIFQDRPLRGRKARTKNTLLAALVAVAVSGMPLWAKDITIPVNDGFEPGSLSIRGYGKGYEFVIAVIALDGQLFVCGVGIYPDASSAAGVRNILHRAAIAINGRRIIKDLTFFGKADRGADLFREMAVCRGTGVPIPIRKFSFEIVWPSGPVRF